MTNINSINLNSIISNGMNLYTKRTCSDNSEMYITSRLDELYQQTVSSRDTYSSRRNLRKMLEGNHLDTSA